MKNCFQTRKPVAAGSSLLTQIFCHQIDAGLLLLLRFMLQQVSRERASPAETCGCPGVWTRTVGEWCNGECVSLPKFRNSDWQIITSGLYCAMWPTEGAVCVAKCVPFQNPERIVEGKNGTDTGLEKCNVDFVWRHLLYVLWVTVS